MEKIMILNHADLETAIHNSQHCQRNWDLNKEIPQADLDLIITAATQCPSKQNIAHYKIHAITNRDIIEKIHENTVGFQVVHTNPQVLANLLLVLEHKPVIQHKDSFAFGKEKLRKDKDVLFQRDAHMSVGIAVGYVYMVSNMLGYSTGCCACFDDVAVRKLLGLDNEILLMMGVGFNNPELDRRIHHTNKDFIFPSIKKEVIQVNYIS